MKVRPAHRPRTRIVASVRESARTTESLAAQAAEIAVIGDAMVAVLRGGGKVLTAGNGGSAADAMHMAEELVGRFKSNRRSLPGIALTADGTALTCIGNDFGFDEVFRRQVQGLGKRGDMLVLFSSSGRSANLRLALASAKQQGLVTVALLGCGGGTMAGVADHELIVCSDVAARIQEAHGVIMHVLLEIVEEAFPA